MKKKSIYSAVMIALTLTMAACGDGSEETVTNKQEQIMGPVPESAITEEESEISEPEVKDSTGELTAEDYQALAEQYREQGRIRKQRDVLEKSYRLYGDQTAFEALQTICVNLEEEDEAIREQSNLMLQNLELEEYLGESINLISTEEWFQTMMPKLYEGNRSYFLQRDGQTILFVQVGYDQSGESYAKVWYLGEQVRVLRKEGDAVQMLVTKIVDGNYQGAFESWTCDGSTGDIYHETGTFGNGVLTGDYKIAIHEGTESSDIFSLWSNKEGMKYTTYNGNFDEQGITTLEQPAEKKIASLISDTDYSTCIVYAIDVNDCLFEGLAEGADPALYTFGIEKMGWEMYPSFTAYHPIEDAETTDEEAANGEQMVTDIQVRVFDGELQVYQNGMWIDMGSVEEHIKADPFVVYENGRKNAAEQEDNQQDAEKQSLFGYQRMGGTIPKDKPVSKPATQKPAETPTPAPTPDPTPAPAPTPPTNDNNDSNNNDNDSNNNNNNSSNNNNNNGGNSGGDNNGGNDVDVEWTPDIL